MGQEGARDPVAGHEQRREHPPEVLLRPGLAAGPVEAGRVPLPRVVLEDQVAVDQEAVGAHEVERLVPGGRQRRDDVGRESRVEEERRRGQERGRPRQGARVVVRLRPAEGRPVERHDEEQRLAEQDGDEDGAQPEAPARSGPPEHEPRGHEQEGEVAPSIPPVPFARRRRGGGRGDPREQHVHGGERGKEQGRDQREEPAPQARNGRVRRQAERREPEGAPEPEGQRAGRGGHQRGHPHARDAPHPHGSSSVAVRPAARSRAPRPPWARGAPSGSAGQGPPLPAPPAGPGCTGGSVRRGRPALWPRRADGRR